ncbi:stage III sporulation protein SpoIIIAB [Proteinivorax hydrogeniformans]|uniref:Stage III sporulation protein SpoIIIAB n=1 Tax=Proteinivorax hydrogeniformans TaxID=1826727 RepID=A0AAU8HR56_9FIRM
MLKVMGAAVLIAATTSYGFQKAQKLQQRTTALRVFQNGLAMLQTEVSYGHTPLPKALKNVAYTLPSPQKEFFINISYNLEKCDGFMLERYWSEELKKDTYQFLTDRDKDILQTLGFSLGKSGIDEQLKHISLTLNKLNAAEQESEQQYKKNGKMWKYLGFFTGLALVLVLL